MKDLHYLSAGALCARIKSGALSAREVTAAILARINSLEPELHAFASVLDERAIAQAEARDEYRASGRPLGLLHGVPIAVKDILDIEGVPTAGGTRVMKDRVAPGTATVVARLEAAGAVVVGKTQLTEGAYGVHHPDIDPPRNPWNPERWPGVSSSGSAVAVAAGMGFAALGSDTGGSIRFPAASCGVVGLKPTYGRVSRHGVFPLAESLDHIGPMTRTVADAARFLQVMAGHDPHDPTSLEDPVPQYVAEPEAGIRGIRVGFDSTYASEGVEPEVVQGVQEALHALEAAGAVVHAVTVPASHEVLVQKWGITCAVECARAHRDYYPSRKAEYGPVLAELIELGRYPPPGAYEELEEVRRLFREEFDALFRSVDVLIAPNMPYLPPPVDEVLAYSEDPARASGLKFTAPFDYSGHPTLSLPIGLSVERLPLTVQLIGPRLAEGTLIRAGAALEKQMPFEAHPIP